MKFKLILLLLLFLLSLGIALPLFKKGLFSIHDDTQSARIYEMGKALSEGYFPVRWVHDLGYGYGYPLFNFYAPLPYYLGGLFYLLSDNLILATKIMYGLGMILAGFSMFLLVSEFLGLYSAFLSSILYIYAPYHAVQIYVRGAVGEYWAYAFVPLVLWGMVKLIRTNKIKWLILTSVFTALLILSHNIISFLFLILLLFLSFLILVLSVFKPTMGKSVIKIWLSLFIGLLLSAFFWLPAITESSLTSVDWITSGGSFYKDHFLYIDQLWDWPWGFAGSAPGRADGMSFKLGKIQVIFGLLGLVIFYLLSVRKKIKVSAFVFGNIIFLMSLISLFMTLPISQKVWDGFSFILKFVQFPWRFIVFMVVGLSFFSGFILNFFNKKLKYVVTSILICLTLLVNIKYFQPQAFENLEEEDYKKENYLRWSVSKISDEYLPSNLLRPNEKDLINQNLIVDGDNLDVDILQDRTSNLIFWLVVPQSRQITLRKTFFPSWSVYLNGKRAEIVNDSGFISFLAPSGLFKVVLLLQSTPIEIVANSISAFTFLGILFFLIKGYDYEKFNS